MPIKFKCPCGRTLRAPDNAQGRKARCPACDRLLRLPSKPEKQTEPPADAPPEPRRDEPSAEVGRADSAKSAQSTEGEILIEGPKEDSKGCILLGESVPKDLKRAKQILIDHGYTVISAADGEQLMEFARKAPPDLILVDVKLDKVSGFQVCRALSDPLNPQNREIWQKPFIMTTPRMRGRDKQYAISLGVKAFIQKPFPPSAICPRIEKALKIQAR